MPLTLEEAAKKLCRYSRWSISNLELQKLLYLSQVRYKRSHPHRRLIDTSFQAWDLGPVAPELYHRAKAFGSDPVKNIFHSVDDEPRSLDKHLYEIFDKYKNRSPSYLVALTHRSGGAWANYYRRGVAGIVIPDAAIDEEAINFKSP